MMGLSVFFFFTIQFDRYNRSHECYDKIGITLH